MSGLLQYFSKEEDKGPGPKRPKIETVASKAKLEEARRMQELEFNKLYDKPKDKAIFEAFFEQLKHEFSKSSPNANDASVSTHRCTVDGCGKAFNLVKKEETGKTKPQIHYQNAADHIIRAHKNVYRDFVVSRAGDQTKEERESAGRRLMEERQKMLEQRASLSTSTSPTTIWQAFKSIEGGDAPKPIHRMAISKFDATMLMMQMADTAAQCNLPMSIYEAPGFRQLLSTIGLYKENGTLIAPCAETIRKYQSCLAQEALEKQIVRVSLVADFTTVMPLLSIQNDVWTTHNGEQVMGINVSGVDPVRVKRFVVKVPLMPATEESLTSQAEAAMVNRGLAQLKLSPEKIYSSTTDNAAVASKGSVINGVVPIFCLVHSTALALSDSVDIADSRNYDIESLEQDDGSGNAVNNSVDDPVGQYLLGVAARAAFFNRSSKAERLLQAYLLENKKASMSFKTWSPTRWTGVYDAALRDLELIKLLPKSFWTDLVSACDISKQKARARLVPGETALINGRYTLSILNVFYQLTKELQSEDMTYAEAYYHILIAADRLGSRKLSLLPRGPDEKNDKISYEAILPGFGKFRMNLLLSLEERLLQDIPDEMIVNLALDPPLLRRFKNFRQVAGTKSTQEISDKILSSVESEAVEQRLLNSMAKVIRERSPSVGKKQAESKENDSPVPDSVLPSSATQRSLDNDDDDDDDIVLRIKRVEKQQLESKTQRKPSGNALEESYDLARVELEAFKAKRLIADENAALEFWENYATTFPNLFIVALQSFSVRPCNARIESDFSVAAAAVPKQRESLTLESLNNILTLKSTKLSSFDILAATRQYLSIIGDRQSEAKRHTKPGAEELVETVE